VTLRFLRSESYTFSRAERRIITRIAESAVAEVRRNLSDTPERIEITVRPETAVTSETATSRPGPPS